MCPEGPCSQSLLSSGFPGYRDDKGGADTTFTFPSSVPCSCFYFSAFVCSLRWHWDPPHSLPRGREGHVFFKLSVSSVTVSISGLTPLCFFHEGLAFTLSLIMLSYDNGIKRKNTESCPSGVLYACPNKQLVLGIVLQLPCPQPHPFYAVLMMNFNHGAVWPRQPSPDQQPSAVKGSLCYCGVSRVKSFFREHTEKPDGFCLHFHL